ncbi:MAG: smalltalk protein, partial [Bacteroidaceae bacterium]|nr:smalltalk protein [Bacteroidaceae bacterium]
RAGNGTPGMRHKPFRRDNQPRIQTLQNTTRKKNNIAETIVKMIVAALTAFLTALGTTSCMGH